jgi:hypothetical protein
MDDEKEEGGEEAWKKGGRGGRLLVAVRPLPGSYPVMIKAPSSIHS